MKSIPSNAFLAVASALLLATLFTMCQRAPSRTSGDLDRLQGHWEGDGVSITISGHDLFFFARQDHWFETTLTLPDETDPAQLHATIVKDNSSDQGNFGAVVVAIFKFEDEALTLVAQPDGSPPFSFDADSGGVSRYDLVRAQPPEIDPREAPGE